MAMSSLIDRGPGRAKLVRVRLPGSLQEWKIGTGKKSRDAAERWRLRFDQLVEAHCNGDNPPPALAKWLSVQPRRTLQRLVEMGLIDARRAEASRPLLDADTPRKLDDVRKATETVPLLDLFILSIASRGNNTARHAIATGRYAARICREAGFTRIEQIDRGETERTVAGWDCTPATRRHHLQAMRSLTQWAVLDGRLEGDPLIGMRLPSADVDPAFNRRPFTADEFVQLLNATDDQGRPAIDDNDRLLYWLAGVTGCRQSTLRQLKRYQLDTGRRPVRLNVEPGQVKQRVGIWFDLPSDLGEALADFTATKMPQAPLLRVPGRNTCVKRIRAACDAAGIVHTPEAGPRVDFHSLRGTAMVMRLDAGLSIREVGQEVIATPRTVERYVRFAKARRAGAGAAALSLAVVKAQSGQSKAADTG